MIFCENRQPADDSCKISYLVLLFLKKAAKFEIAICCKLYVALYGLTLHNNLVNNQQLLRHSLYFAAIISRVITDNLIGN